MSGRHSSGGVSGERGACLQGLGRRHAVRRPRLRRARSRQVRKQSPQIAAPRPASSAPGIGFLASSGGPLRVREGLSSPSVPAGRPRWVGVEKPQKTPLNAAQRPEYAAQTPGFERKTPPKPASPRCPDRPIHSPPTKRRLSRGASPGRPRRGDAVGGNPPLRGCRNVRLLGPLLGMEGGSDGIAAALHGKRKRRPPRHGWRSSRAKR